METAFGQVVDYAGAQQVTGIGVNTLYSLVHHRKIPHLRITSRIVRFVRRELVQWMESHRVAITTAEVRDGR